MDFDESARARIAAALRTRRAQLGMSQEEVARASGGLLSTASLRVMEGSGRSSFRAKSLTGVARALGWPSDAVTRIAAGADPASFAPVSPPTSAVAPIVAGVELVTTDRLDGLRADVARQHALIVELTERVRRLEASAGVESGGAVVAAAASSGDLADVAPAGRRRTTRARVTSFEPDPD